MPRPVSPQFRAMYRSEYYSLEDAVITILVEETTGRKMGENPGVLEG